MWKDWKSKGQNGAMIIMTAFLLPIVLACTGVAIDVGNLYYHKSILQNAADAAAIGGAKVGGKEITKIEELDTKFNKASAKEKATQLIDDDKKYAIKDDATKFGYYKSKSSPKTTRYYTVHLEEDIPLYFTKYFIWDLAGFIKDGKAIVSADAYAKVGFTEINEEPKKSSPFTDLFIYSKHLDAVNSINNPDNYKLNGQISSTFTGRARCTTEEAMKNTIYSEQTQWNNKDRQNAPYPLDRFFTKNAKGMSVYAASDPDQKASYDDTTGEFSGTGYWSKATLDTNYKMSDYWNNTIVKEYLDNTSYTAITDQNKQNFNTAALLAAKSPLIFDIGKGASRNLTLDINASLAKTTDSDADTPYYVIVKAASWGGTDVINFNIHADTVRPIILCLDASEANQYAKVHFNIDSGKTFRGVIYAPRVSDEGILVNSAGGTFLGSIISEKITLRGDNSTFEYKPFGVADANGSGGGSSGKGSYSSTPNIALSDDATDIDL